MEKKNPSWHYCMLISFFAYWFGCSVGAVVIPKLPIDLNQEAADPGQSDDQGVIRAECADWNVGLGTVEIRRWTLGPARRHRS
jgi:hypothetical protein